MENWIVEVFINAQTILTIDSGSVDWAKDSLTVEDKETIRDAAKSLLTFAGEPPNDVNAAGQETCYHCNTTINIHLTGCPAR